jgi:hypothetical protein
MMDRSRDPDRARELMANDPTDWQKFRPDIPGTASVGHDGDAWTMAIYFTSEQAARAGEQKEPRPRMQEMMKEMDALTLGEPVFFDLRDPWASRPELTRPERTMRDPKLRLAWTRHCEAELMPRSCGRDLAQSESVLTGRSWRQTVGLRTQGGIETDVRRQVLLTA